MTEIFFGLTNKHVENFESIIRLKRLNNINDHRILITDKKNYEEKLWDEVIISEINFLKKGSNLLVDLKYMLEKIKAYSMIIKKIEKYKTEHNINIYLAYIEDILSNYLFFNFNKNSEIILVEDGILNYYNHSFQDISKGRFYLKKILSLFYGIAFEKYEGHSSGINYTKVKSQFLSFPKLAHVKNRVKKLPFEKVKLAKFENNLFIVGTENLAQVVGHKNYKKYFFEFIDELKNRILKYDINIIYYKPRHVCLDFELEYLMKTFPKYHISILDNNLIAEEDYFNNIKSIHIASMISSALISIYSRVAEEDKEKLNIMYKPVNNHKISRLFEKLDFNKL